MRKEEIQDLIRIVEESTINELEIREGRRTIRISKGGTVSAAPAAAQIAPQAELTPPTPLVVPGSSPEDSAELASNLKQVTSPMVGTFYRSPAPGSDPFVDVGHTVAVGQTVCIVEAMKLMNEIGSDFNGVVRKVLVENAQPVEYGQPLFLVESG